MNHMKCVKCNKDFEGNFCPYCGNKVVIKQIIKEENIQNKKSFLKMFLEEKLKLVWYILPLGAVMMALASLGDDNISAAVLFALSTIICVAALFKKIGERRVKYLRCIGIILFCVGYVFLLLLNKTSPDDNLVYIVKEYKDPDVDYAIGEYLEMAGFEVIWKQEKKEGMNYVSAITNADGMVSTVTFKLDESTGDIPVLHDVLLDGVSNEELFYEYDYRLFGNDTAGVIFDVANEDTYENYSTEVEVSEIQDNTVASSDAQYYKETYVGTWTDTYSQRCWMVIESADGIHYNIDINWSSSASENTHWEFTGIIDSDTGYITYSGDMINEVYNDDGTIEKNFVYTDGSGQFYIGKYNMLIWDDWKENAGAECLFEKSSEEEGYEEPEEDTSTWYNIYRYYESTGGTYFEITCMNDVMLEVRFYVGSETMEWMFDIDTMEVGTNGELIYSESGDSLTYYPDDHHIYFYTTDGLCKGEYYPL